MGAYLTHPVTEKISSDEANDHLTCGVSSMQGWRVSQEDAHNCILNLSENVSLLAVYDGHGGKDVAEYTAQKLPDFIKSTESFKNGDYEAALKEAFLKFDKSLTEPDVIAVLKEIADKNNDGATDTEDEDDDNLGDLKQEAEMPLDEVIAKYTEKIVEQKVMKWKRDSGTPASPFLRAKPSKFGSEGECSSSSAGEVSGSIECAASSSSCSSSSAGNVAERAVSSSSSSSREITRKSLAEKYSNGEHVAPDSTGVTSVSEMMVNGNGPADASRQHEEISSSDLTEKLPSTGKGKALMKNVPSPAKKKESVSPDELFKKFVSSSPGDSSSESESDENFMGQDAVSSSDDDVKDGGDSGEGSLPDSAGCEDEEDEDDDDDEEDDEDEDETVDEDDFGVSTTDEPGSDSGCTAVVALVAGNKVYVANAGDSRCVASRGGVAVDLSVDHKPEDELELARITKAGGKVTSEGRVNGGLNLSRALGDHVYKQVADLPAEEQMISPMPDVKVLDVTPDVEFLVLACDGIWNFMSSQEVVEYVRPKLQKNPVKISSICEELFDTCLAPDTGGDGTGCDNMTAIIVRFRGATEETTVPAVKRKTEDCESSECETKRSKTDQQGPESTTDAPSCSSDVSDPTP